MASEMDSLRGWGELLPVLRWAIGRGRGYLTAAKAFLSLLSLSSVSRVVAGEGGGGEREEGGGGGGQWDQY